MIQTFNYNNSDITFQKGSSVMVNATEMAKSFGKQPSDWTRQKSTAEFLNALSSVRGIPRAELIQSVMGGNSTQGTWMHEDVAIEFARWLSPAFAIWCNDRIKELMRDGVTTTATDDEAIIKAIEILHRRIEEGKRCIETQQACIETQSEQLRIQAPKVAYYDAAMDSSATYSTTAIAKDLGTNAQALNQKLHVLGIQFKRNGTWFLYSKYDGKDYIKVIPQYYTRADGTMGNNPQTRWTEKGRQFLLQLRKEGKL